MAQNDWQELKARAEAYFQTCELAANSGKKDLIQNALENIHLAVELAMKSAIGKNGGIYYDHGWKGHDLQSLSQCRFGDNSTSILVKMKALGAHSLLSISLSNWSMDCRYKALQSFEDMQDAIKDYKGLYLWIKNNLLN